MNESVETSSLKFFGARMIMLYSGRGGGGATPGWPDEVAGRALWTASAVLGVTAPEGETTASCWFPRGWLPRDLAPESLEERDWPHGNSSGSGLVPSGSIDAGVRMPAWHDAERCCPFVSRFDRDDLWEVDFACRDDDDCDDD